MAEDLIEIEAHIGETGTKREGNLPSFYYEIDQDKEYTSDEIIELCKKAHNEAVEGSIKAIHRQHMGLHMRTYRREIERMLKPLLIPNMCT